MRKLKTRSGRLISVGVAVVAGSASILMFAPSASADSNTVSASYNCSTWLGSGTGTEDITVTAPATANIGDTVPITVDISAPGIDSLFDGTASGTMDFVYGNGWLDSGSFRLYSPTYTLAAGGSVPGVTLTGYLHVTTAGTYGMGPIGANMAVTPSGWGEIDAGCTVSTNSWSLANIVVS